MPRIARMRSAVTLPFLALITAACGVQLPFGPAPEPPIVAVTPGPTPPSTPTPTPRPNPVVEVQKVQVAVVETAPNPLTVAVAFRLKNPSSEVWLLQAVATGSLATPDGRPLPLARPTVTVDLAPGEEKWFAFPAVDTLGSVVGKAEVALTGGQWLPAATYPYRGGVPLAVVKAKEQKTTTRGAADFVVRNDGDLGFSGGVRGFAFDASDTFLGLLECPQRLYAARAETTVACVATRAKALEAAKLVFAAYPDLRPVLVTPSPTPSPATARPTPAPTPTGR